jgi:ABC-type nitrate/sulfonate/bicarbonate transport system ATPase subunit
MATVEIRDVRKAFGSTKVLHGVSVDIADGQFVVLVGPSGCGKSTLLRMLAGLENITGGDISIGGRVVNNVPPKDRDIAMVFQNYALYPHMTVFENMAFSLKLAGAPKDFMEQEVQKAARILGLEQLLHRYPRQLSGGQRQRVAMGRAIVRNPQVFLFDEPLSNLDAKLRVQILWRITLPLAVPGLISAGIFSFTLSWNEFIYALAFIQSTENKTVPVAILTELVTGDVYQWGALMAGSLLGSIPVALFYSFFVDYYVSSLTGAVKE